MIEHGGNNTLTSGEASEKSRRTPSDGPKNTKHLPLRTCLICRKVRYKQELIRLVKLSDGHIEIDMKGKIAGRGMYICRNPECWEKLSGNKGLDRIFQTKVTPDNRASLVEQGKDLLL